MQHVVKCDVLIVGAGLSGLMAAQALRGHGLRLVLVDKGASVGGRMATRRIGPGQADHGAQFFTVRTPEFQTLVDDWLADDWVYPWSTGFSSGSLAADPPDGHPRYAARGGMNALTKRLAQKIQPDADIRLKTRLTSLTPTLSTWQAMDADCCLYVSKALVVTPPVPQSLALLGLALDKLPASDREALQAITYAPCVAGLFWVNGEVDLPEPGALQRPDAPVSWIADNRRKGISPEATIITVHAGPDYSRALWEQPEAQALAALQAELAARLKPGAAVVEAQLKRWRYALPTRTYAARYLMPAGVPPLAFAGDAFGGPRVEGAVLSGIEAGNAVVARLAV